MRYTTLTLAILAGCALSYGPGRRLDLPTDVDTLPSLIGTCTTDYPQSSRNAGHAGLVELLVEVLEDGSVGMVEVNHAPTRTLGISAAEAMKQCRFHPALRNAVPARTRIPYRFAFIID
jgi:TonB family protein